MFIQFLNLLATIISVISLLIVTYGALIAFIAFTINELKRFTGKYTSINIRRLRATFGTYLLLGLEFLIASDILKTVLEPTLNELAILGGIVVLRTVLSVFLNKEIKELDKLEKYMNFVIEKLELKEAIFNIIFVSNEEIHNINREYRHTDRVTDVISFALEDNPDVVYDSFRLLGDIYIAIDVAYDQAVEYNHSREREVCFLATHGLLHLLGYDHMTLEEEKVMFGKQEELLNEFEIKR